MNLKYTNGCQFSSRIGKFFFDAIELSKKIIEQIQSESLFNRINRIKTVKTSSSSLREKRARSNRLLCH